MIYLSASDTLQVVTSSSSAVDVYSVHNEASVGGVEAGREVASIVSATTTTVAQQPTRRKAIDHFSLVNKGGASNDITVQLFNGSVATVLFKATLDSGESLTYGPDGINLYNPDGVKKNGNSGNTVASSIVGTGQLLVAPATGEFVSNVLNATALSTQAQVANRTVIAPFIPSVDLTIDQLGVSVSTLLASNNAKCIIYASDLNGRPSTVLKETSDISTAANATVMSTITPLQLTAGTLYWVGVRASGTFTLRTLGVGASPVVTYTNAATPVAESALILTETYANAAATWTYAASQHSNAQVPLVLMRVA